MSGGSLRVYEIDGLRFDTIAGFYNEISRVLVPGHYWGRNLDAFNDILSGGFGTPDEGFVLVWKNAQLSRLKLGDSTFKKLLEILREHAPGMRARDSNVVLRLE